MKKKSQEISIGERVREVFDKRNMSITQFAELLHYDPSNVHNIFRRKKIDIELLLEISKILNHDFVGEICAEHGYPNDLLFSKISLILDINGMDAKALNKLIKIIKHLKIKDIDISKD